MKKIALKPGPVVEGDDFYGREGDLRNAWKLLSEGTSLLLSAPRRVGKTSFSKKMLKLAEVKKWKTLYLDLEGISTENDFVKLFKEELQEEKWWEKVTSKVEDAALKIFDSIDEVEVGGNKVTLNSDVWRSSTYGKIMELLKSTGDILIVIDELTIFLTHLMKQNNGNEKVEFFLEWLRKIRQTSGTKVRWILCSSVGIENFASMHQLSKHLNDIYHFHIGAFTEDEAKDFISRMDVDERLHFAEEHIQYILDKLIWYLPFFIQLLIEKINFLICIDCKQLSNKTIDEAYNRLIAESHFNTWDERLKYYYELENDARKILKLCAVLPNGRKREDLLANLFVKRSDIEKIDNNLSKLLVMLQNDGYLAEHNGKYIFRSPLLRDFWYGRFIK